MGIQKTVLNFMVQNAKGKLIKSSLLSMPKAQEITAITGLKYSHNINGDFFQPQKIDPTLSKRFLSKILKCDHIVKMKDMMLKAMGYKNPEIVEVARIPVTDKSGFAMEFGYDTGKLYIGDIEQYSKEQIVALLRHEFDHLDKAAKVVKAKAIDAYEQAIKEALEKRGIPFQGVNKEFFTKISEQADIRDFDGNLYLNALKNSVFQPGTRAKSSYEYFLDFHNYASNPVEEAAYRVQSKVQQLFGNSNVTIYDSYCTEMKKINKLLKRFDQKDIEFTNLQQASILAQTEKGLDILKKISQGANLAQEEAKFVQNEFMQFLLPDQILKIFQTVRRALEYEHYDNAISSVIKIVSG